jgi:hypothetical protein
VEGFQPRSNILEKGRTAMARRLVLVAVIGMLALSFAVPTQAAPLHQQGVTATYSVLYAEGVSPAAARTAIAAIGGTVIKENRAVGLAVVRTANPSFADEVALQPALYGAAMYSVPIGYAPNGGVKPSIEREVGPSVGVDKTTAAAAPNVNEPFYDKQWGMEMIDAGPNGSWPVQPGDPGVTVGIIDTGLDASHPDIAPNFNAALSRNFTTDIPLVDGPCEEEPDGSCQDPADVDEGGHGTHVGGIVGAALNGIGVGGVAPSISLVNLRAGQDSGFFFLQPSVDALTYAGDNGIDVVNMSYFIDPWQYNCPNDPTASRAEQQQQRTIIEATTRALNYAHDHGVTLVAAFGNDNRDMDNKASRPDTSSPNFPPGNERERPLDQSCVLLELRQRGGCLGARRRPARVLRDPAVQLAGHQDPLELPARAGPRGGAHQRQMRVAQPARADRPPRSQRRHQGVRRVRVPAGHVDGLAARGGRRRADRQRVRQRGSGPRRPADAAGRRAGHPVRLGARSSVSPGRPHRLPGPGPAG